LKALDRITLDVYDGEKVVIIGPSGSGKSTLLRSINRLEEIDRGRIIVNSVDIYDPMTDINKFAKKWGWFSILQCLSHKTVIENLTLAQRVVRKRSRKEAQNGR